MSQTDSALSTDNGYSVYSAIYPKALLDIVQKNHNNYCCKNYDGKISSSVESYCKNNPTDTYIDSPQVFDHLIDVGFRYLDGVKSLQYEGAALDKKGTERREKINAYGENPNGAIPLAIMNDYTTYWWDRNKDLDLIQSNNDTCEASKIRFAKYNTEWDTTPLVEKYFVICELSACLAGGNGSKNAYLSRCQDMAVGRIMNEDDYVQALLIHQWQQAISTNFNAYARSYVNNQRLNQLLEKIVTMAKGIGFVDSKVPEMTRMCSA